MEGGGGVERGLRQRYIIADPRLISPASALPWSTTGYNYVLLSPYVTALVTPIQVK